MNNYKIIQGDCIKLLSNKKFSQEVDLTFLDPPFNQDKEYNLWNDKLPENEYWRLMKDVCKGVYETTSRGGALYFMQREKNAEFVLQCLRETGWSLQNFIIWKKNLLLFLAQTNLVSIIK
jgi:DNA modification methylase